MQDLAIDSTSVKAHQHAAGAKKRGESAETGRSRGGLTTKIHGVVDGLGNPSGFLLPAGNETDIRNAPPLLRTLSISGSIVNADKGYDCQEFAEWLKSLGAIPNISSRATNKIQRECDWWEYKERYLIENFWQKIKQFRRVAPRYDKLAKYFLGFVYIASILVLLK